MVRNTRWSTPREHAGWSDRARGATAAGAVGALVLAGLVAVVPSVAAAPARDCAAPYPVSKLRTAVAAAAAKDDFVDVDGLTVSRGTTPQEFHGEVLGVLTDGIAPGLDMIVAELHSDAIDKAGGIWQGMSGSPVYAKDGRLIGAVSYGLAYGSSPVAGITPFEDMQGYLGAAKAAPKVAVGPKLAARIATATDTTRAEAERGLRQLPMPVGIGGVDLVRASKAAGQSRAGRFLTAGSYRIGRSAGSSAAGVDTVVAGGNVAAALAHGDISYAGVGTVTSVCGNRVVAFGHPMSFTGSTRLGLAAADAVYVQEDPLGVPFKVANLGELGGTITDDRLAGIAGTFGRVPTSVPFRSKVAYEDRKRTGVTQVLQKAALADVALFGAMANHDRVVDGVIGGSETQAWTVSGTRSGKAFRLRYSDRFQSADDIGFSAVFGLPDVVYSLSTMSGVKVTAVTNDVKVSDDKRKFKVAKIYQRTAGRWSDVTGRTAKVRAGKDLVLKTVLTGTGGGTKNLYQRVTVPKKLKGKSGTAVVAGGNATQDEFFGIGSFDALRATMRQTIRNDEVRLTVRVGKGDSAVLRTRTSDPLPRVVGSQKRITVKVVG